MSTTIEFPDKKRSKQKSLVLIILLVTITGFYFLIFDFIVPKTAAFTIPHKWRMIPLRQTKEIVRNYFGEPLPAQPADKNDTWASGSKGKMYFLRVYYVSDTIGSAYSIHYRFKNWFSSRDYVVDSVSIR